MSFTCIQSIPLVKDEIRARAYGADGVFDLDYYGNVLMRGKEAVVKANVPDLYSSGVVVNVNEFHAAISQGDCSNRTVVPSVRSNLTAVLGREAAYHRKELTLASLIKHGRKLELDLKGLKV